MIPPGSRVQVGVHPPPQVPALPSLSYVQKVDAWRAGQSIGLGLGGLLETMSEPNPLTCIAPPRSSGSQQHPHLAADSHVSGLQVGPSVDASSVPSLEVENCTSYLTSKGSLPPPFPKPLQLHPDEKSSVSQNLKCKETFENEGAKGADPILPVFLVDM